jgi:hypothetical protein
VYIGHNQGKSKKKQGKRREKQAKETRQKLMTALLDKIPSAASGEGLVIKD